MGLKSLLQSRVIRYLIVGCANTLVGLGVIFFCMYVLRFGNATANLVGYAIGIVFSFALNKRWTFDHSGPVLPAFLRFAGVLCVAYVANLATVVTLTGIWNVNRYLAQLGGVPPYVLVGYLGSSLFAFGASRGSNPGVTRDVSD